jgi:hypothetical protein
LFIAEESLDKSRVLKMILLPIYLLSFIFPVQDTLCGLRFRVFLMLHVRPVIPRFFFRLVKEKPVRDHVAEGKKFENRTEGGKKKTKKFKKLLKNGPKKFQKCWK